MLKFSKRFLYTLFLLISSCVMFSLYTYDSVEELVEKNDIVEDTLPKKVQLQNLPNELNTSNNLDNISAQNIERQETPKKYSAVLLPNNVAEQLVEQTANQAPRKPKDSKHFENQTEETLQTPFIVQASILSGNGKLINENKTPVIRPIPMPFKQVKGFIKSGDTLASILKPYASPLTIHTLINDIKKVYNFAKIFPGRAYSIFYAPAIPNLPDMSARLLRFSYDIDREEQLIVDFQVDTFVAIRSPIHYDVDLVLLSGDISNSFFESFLNLGEKPALALTFSDIFSFEIDFIKDIRKGDSFSILAEKKSKDGEFSHYGRILAASFTNQGNTHKAFYYTVPLGSASAKAFAKYYTDEGASMQKMLLKAPLSFTRVTSGYSMNRLHPIYKKRRPHQAIDYGAPTGTPIKSVGDGIVTYAGRRGGYGKHVTIRHGGGFESMYSHMSRYGRGIKKGVRVKQGQQIGAVGSTGLSTGPHLDFRLKRHGTYVNPQKVVTPRVDPVPKKYMDEYLQQVVVLQKYLQNEEPLSRYTPEQIL